jgi:hypothetical protein
MPDNTPKRLFQVTVADEQGVIVDTGWVAMEVPLVPAGAPQPLPIAGAALFDAVLNHGLDEGFETTREDAAQS